MQVKESDWPLQAFEWCGRYFGELKLVFGTLSSPCLYNNVACLVKDVSTMEAEMNPLLVGQQLDDVLCADVERSGKVQRWTDTYKGTCKEVGVKLASTSDPEKAFECKKSGIVLGLDYNLGEWTVGVPEDKWTRLVRALGEAREADEISGENLRKLLGKIEYYR